MTDIQLFAENFYILDDGRVRQFLILGEDEALLIDTGFEDSNVYHTVKNITQLPVKVIMTHGDPDHAGGLKDFGKCYLHKGDWPLISEGIQLEPLKEGDVFKCGGYTLETIEIPGHTYGSTAFVDWEKKGRRSAIEVFDLESKQLLMPVEIVRDYQEGKYVVFSIDRPVRLRINQVRGTNAALCALFFD